MEYQEVFQKIDQLSGVLIFCGEEAYVRASAIAALRKHLFPDESLASMNEMVFDGTVDLDRFTESCETLPFLCEKRLVYWKNCPLLVSSGRGEEKRPATPAWSQYLSRTPEDTIVLLETQGNPDGRLEWVKQVDRSGNLVKFTYLTPVQIEKWMDCYARDAGKTLERGCADALSQMMGPALSDMIPALDKAIAYSGQRSQITLNDIQTVTVPSVAYRGYQIGEFLLQGQRDQALESIQTLLFQGTDAVALLAAIAATFRQLLYVKALVSEGVGAEQIAKKLEIRHRFVLNKAMSRVRGLSVQTLKQALDACADSDYAIKSGQTNANMALYQAVFRILSALQPKKGSL